MRRHAGFTPTPQTLSAGRRLVWGFTLIETMVAGSLLVSLSVVTMVWLGGAADLWWTSSAQQQAREAVEQASSRMVRELRMGTRAAGASPPNAAIPAPPGNTQMEFYLPADLDPNDGNTTIVDAIGNIEWSLAPPPNNPTRVQYVYDAPSRQLRRIQGGQTVVLANGVTAATFADAGIDPSLRANEIRVTLTAQQTTPLRRAVASTSSQIVRLRN